MGSLCRVFLVNDGVALSVTLRSRQIAKSTWEMELESATPSATTCHPPRRAVLIACAAAMTNVAFGYDVGIISGSLVDIATSLRLSTIEQEMVTSGLNFVSGIGAICVSGNILDRLGRKATLLIASLLLLLGSFVVTLADSFLTLLLGRALQGLGSGSGWCACTVYITEIAPQEWRGALVSISDIGINVGILLGYCADRAVNLQMVDEPGLRWRVAMGLSALLPLVYCCACHPWLPESPRWLVLVGRDADAARALQRVSPVLDSNSVEQQVAVIRAARRVDEASWASSVCPSSAKPRGRVAIALLLGLAQQLTGTEAILYYTPRILNQCALDEGSGDAGGGGVGGGGVGGDGVGGGVGVACTPAGTVFLINLGVGMSKLVGELIAAALVELTGRRRALVASNLLVSLAVFAIALQFRYGWSTAFGALALSLSMLFFSLGPGPLTWVVINEMLPMNVRGKVVSLALLCNRFGSGTIALTFLSLKAAVGVFAAFALYAALGVLVTCFYVGFVPDATGMSLEQNEDGHASSGVEGARAVGAVHLPGASGGSMAVATRSTGWTSLVEDGASCS